MTDGLVDLENDVGVLEAGFSDTTLFHRSRVFAALHGETSTVTSRHRRVGEQRLAWTLGPVRSCNSLLFSRERPNDSRLWSAQRGARVRPWRAHTGDGAAEEGGVEWWLKVSMVV